jgi:hypothetical protein
MTISLPAIMMCKTFQTRAISSGSYTYVTISLDIVSCLETLVRFDMYMSCLDELTRTLDYGKKLTVQQILAYGIDHGLSHARKAVEEAELAIKTHKNDHDQVAKLFGLAQRTLALIESQEPAMEKLRQAEESSDGVERVKKLVTEHAQKVEVGQAQDSSQEPVKANLTPWSFKLHK